MNINMYRWSPQTLHKWFGPTLLTLQTRSAYIDTARDPLRGLFFWNEAQKKNGRGERQVLVKARTAGE